MTALSLTYDLYQPSAKNPGMTGYGHDRGSGLGKDVVFSAIRRYLPDRRLRLR